MGPVTMDKWVCASVSLYDMRSLRTLKTKALNHTEELKKKSIALSWTPGRENPDCNYFSLSQLEKQTQQSAEAKDKRGW